MVKLGFQVLNAGPLATRDHVIETARAAEALGYDSLVVTDHIVIPRRIESRYPYNATGRLAVPADADYLEPISMLCFVAGATRRIRFGPSVLVLPYRNPVLTAKMLATIDVLSGGRLFVGVGVGWLAEEFAAMASPPFAERGRVTDEWLEILIRLWTEDNPVIDGKFYQVREIGCSPKPVQKPHPPIFVGGNSRAAIRRAARLGQSWHAFRIPADELRGLVAYLREQVAASGRKPDECGLSVRYGVRVVGPGGDTARRPPEEPGRVLVGTAAEVAEQLKPVIELGPTHAIFDCRTGSYAEMNETMERLTAEVWPLLAGVGGAR
ncbi:MAG: TIGR03619 family F420-dependent LLM class oxidoreductase [Candidatus Rokubacteria bacterium]|nr:TIGR03619 family F420-dependent LLM class oxidoreductase [Candidatus Rokubacteria bacterium]